jgi:transcriptional regulator with XRE-family HTH domain
MKIGEKLILLRKEKGLSQTDLAKKLETSLSTLGRWERGDALPDVADLKKLSEIFGVTADFIIFDDVPRDGRVDIPDLHLLYQFEEAATLDEEKRTVIKQFLDAFLFKEKIEKIEKNMDNVKKPDHSPIKKVGTRPIPAERHSSRKN